MQRSAARIQESTRGPPDSDERPARKKLRSNQTKAQHALPPERKRAQKKERTAMDVYSIITERIIEKLEAGTIPWHKPWRSIGVPQNLESKKYYRGINVWLLTAQGYISPYWATLRQLNELGGRVRKGEKSTPVVFWRIYVDGVEVKANNDQHGPGHEQEEGQGRRRFVLRYYSVFNTEQCELPPSVSEKLVVPEQRTMDV
jgi:antirestriction protein ArdC